MVKGLFTWKSEGCGFRGVVVSSGCFFILVSIASKIAAGHSGCSEIGIRIQKVWTCERSLRKLKVVLTQSLLLAFIISLL